jgi:hypothetical protein
MVTGFVISSGMEVKTSGGRLLEINEAGVTQKPCDQPDGDQQTGDGHRRARRQAGSTMR